MYVIKKSELAAELSYLKPDVVCGSESWPRDVKSGANLSTAIIRSSEVSLNNYVADRNDRDGGVFILVERDIISEDQPEFVSECETCWMKIKLNKK